MKTKSLLTSSSCFFLLCLLFASCSQTRHGHTFDYRDHVQLDSDYENEPEALKTDTASQAHQEALAEPVQEIAESGESSTLTPFSAPVSPQGVKKNKLPLKKLGKEWISNVENYTPQVLAPDKEEERSAGFGLRLVGWILIIAGLITVFSPWLVVGIILMLLGLLFVVVGIRQRSAP